MTLKELFIDWLTESRYVRSLELRAAELRLDYTERLNEKDQQIGSLQAELASLRSQNGQFLTLLVPRLAAPQITTPTLPVPDFAMPLDWQTQLQRLVQDDITEESTNV